MAGKNDPFVELITSSSDPAKMIVLQTAVKRFATLMAEVVAQDDAYPGMSLDIILSMLAYKFQCGPNGLAAPLRALSDALDAGETIVSDAPRQPKPN